MRTHGQEVHTLELRAKSVWQRCSSLLLLLYFLCHLDVRKYDSCAYSCLPTLHSRTLCAGHLLETTPIVSPFLAGFSVIVPLLENGCKYYQLCFFGGQNFFWFWKKLNGKKLTELKLTFDIVGDTDWWSLTQFDSCLLQFAKCYAQV